MLRTVLLYLSGADWARNLVTRFPPARRVARRFVAGESLDDALRAASELNARGLLVTLDYLGESVHAAEDVEAVTAAYVELVGCISQDSLRASISLKLTHLGLDISESLCMDALRRIFQAAQEAGVLVTIDMEGSAYTDTTLRIYRTLRDEYGFANAGTVIQSALHRSVDDMRQLMEEGARIRICKGAYLEPPEIAHTEKSIIDAVLIDIMIDALNAPPPAYLEIATHDDKIINAAIDAINDGQLNPERSEFQMLYGIRTDRQAELVESGYRMRVYVPFGQTWYPYFMRRLAERPANLTFFIRALFGG